MRRCPTCKTPWQSEETITECFHERYSKEGVPDYMIKDNPTESVADAAAKTASSYGCTPETPKHFGKDVILIELRGVYDGALYNLCQVCDTYYNRFSGQAYVNLPEEHHTPYNQHLWDYYVIVVNDGTNSRVMKGGDGNKEYHKKTLEEAKKLTNEYHVHRSTDAFNITEQIAIFLEEGGTTYGCGACLDIRNSNASEACPHSTMMDFYEIVEECDKIVSF